MEYVEARRAVTRMISPPTIFPLRATYQLEPLGDGCIFSIGVEFDAHANFAWPEEERDEWRRMASRALERVRQTLAADAADGAV